jgi:2-methylcitrate dehydratase PrpD
VQPCRGGWAGPHHPRARLRVDDIAQIEARISPFMDRLVGGAFEPQTNPQVVAQFSLRYALAAILLRGRIGIAEIQPDAVRDPAIRSIAERITLSIDPANTAELAPATLIVRLRDGREIRHTETGMPGDFQNPLGDAEFAAKLEDCARWGDSPPGSQWLSAIGQAVGRIEEQPDIDTFISSHLER